MYTGRPKEHHYDKVGMTDDATTVSHPATSKVQKPNKSWSSSSSPSEEMAAMTVMGSNVWPQNHD